MPRDGSGVYTLPNGTIPVISNTVIASAPYNAGMADLVQDANTPRPVTAGGTGATNASDARENLGAIGQDNFLDAYSIGDGYYTARTLDARWLKRNGAILNSVDYPTLAALLPALPDTINWTATTTGQSNPLYAIEQDGDDRYVSVGNSGTIITSTDRSSWASVPAGTAGNLQHLVKMPTFWLAAGTLVPSGGGVTSRSTDGVAWSAANLSPTNVLTEVVGMGIAGTNVLISGYDSSGGIIHKILYGTSGTSWTEVVVAGSGKLAASSSRVVMVTGTGMVLTSDNQGASWTTRIASGFLAFNDICWDAINSLFIAVGNSGLLRTSPDGIAWTTRTTSVGFSLESVRSSPSGLIAVGSTQNNVIISTNATTWITKAVPNTSGRALLADKEISQNYMTGNTTTILVGVRTLPTQFQVPNDSPTYGWIKALDELP